MKNCLATAFEMLYTSCVMMLPAGRNETVSNNRDSYWDLVKALLIFLVIWGHCIQFVQAPYVSDGTTFWDSPCFKGIYLFHMPLFMSISGYFAAASIRKRGISSLRRYACRLLIPALSYGLICIIFEWCAHHSLNHIFQRITALWFLIVVFECVCIYYPFRQYTGRVSRFLLLILPVCIVTSCNHYCSLFPAADQFSYLWPFFIAGATFNERGLKGVHIRKWHVVFMLPVIPLVFVVPKQLFVYITPLDLTISAITYDIARTCVAAVLCIGFLGLAQCLQSISRHTLVQKIGQATLALYVIQSIQFSALKTFLPHGLSELSNITVVALALIALLVFYALYAVLCRIPVLPFFLFGEPKR